jgi:hypothetical protein
MGGNLRAALTGDRVGQQASSARVTAAPTSSTTQRTVTDMNMSKLSAAFNQIGTDMGGSLYTALTGDTGDDTVTNYFSSLTDTKCGERACHVHEACRPAAPDGTLKCVGKLQVMHSYLPSSSRLVR